MLRASLVLTTALLAGCSPELKLDQRPIPAQLPAEQRQEFRKLYFDGAHNFRDLGGYQSEAGGSVRWGMLYRSDKLSNISPTDEQYLEKLEIRRIVDFRAEAEWQAAPDKIAPDSSIAIQHMPITVAAADIGKMQQKILTGDVAEGELDNLLVDANRQFVAEFTPVYSEWLHSLLNQNSYPTVFHCTAGKDRAGLAAALVLLAVGVPRDVVMEDYLATNIYTEKFVEQTLTTIRAASMFQTDPELVKPILSVEERYLNAAFEEMESQYGSIDAYIRDGLQFSDADRAALRALLLEPASE